MRTWLIALSLALGAESVALACSCLAPESPEESRRFAREAVQEAIAIVEAEALSEYRPGGPGEQVRVHRILWGEAPREFRVARREFASSASCDLLLRRGERKRLILYSAPAGGEGQAGTFTIQNLCSDFLLSERDYLAVTLEEARRRGNASNRSGERG